MGALFVLIFCACAACSSEEPRPASRIAPEDKPSSPIMTSGPTVQKVEGYETPAESLVIKSSKFPDNFCTVTLPLDYFEKPHKKFPLVIVFGGAGECARSPRQGSLAWMHYYKADEAVKALARGRLETADFRGFVSEGQLKAFNHRLQKQPYRGVILACPYSPPLSPSHRMEFPDYEAYVMDELIPALTERYRVEPGHIGIDGVSMGGARSMYYGFKYPEVFASIGSVQGAFGPFMEIYEGLIKAKEKALKTRAIQIVTSDHDVMAPSVERMHHLLTGLKIPHRFSRLTGPHDYVFNQGPGCLALLVFHNETPVPVSTGPVKSKQVPGNRTEMQAPSESGVMEVAEFRKTNDQMHQALEEGLFTAARLMVSRGGETLYAESYGTLGGAGTPAVTSGTFFDLASLTKVLATTPVWMILASEKPGILDRPLSRWFPDVPPDKAGITPRWLLAHGSGLPAWRPYYLLVHGTNRVLEPVERIFQEPLDYEPGRGCIYSDLGFMLLAAIVRAETGAGLPEFCKERVYEPLGLTEELCFLPDAEKRSIAATRPGEQAGLVNDLNCRAMRGISGHAGLFGTARGVTTLAQEILASLKSGGRLFDPGTVRMFTSRAALAPDCTRALGFDTPSAEGSTSGRHFSLTSLGHTGFTGTSLWMDPEKDLIVVLLTNRVFAGESDMRIKSFRPLIHDLIMEETRQAS